jgi:PhnB protein
MADWKEDGYHTVTAYLTVDDAEAAIDFYRNAFGATEHMRLQMGDKIAHADVLIGDTHVMLSDEFPDMDKLGPKARGGATSSLMVYVPDVDAAFGKAVAAGAEVVRPVVDQFYGDRSGWLRDPFGHEWTISTHVEDVWDEEMHQRMQAMMEEGEG